MFYNINKSHLTIRVTFWVVNVNSNGHILTTSVSLSYKMTFSVPERILDLLKKLRIREKRMFDKREIKMKKVTCNKISFVIIRLDDI